MTERRPSVAVVAFALLLSLAMLPLSSSQAPALGVSCAEWLAPGSAVDEVELDTGGYVRAPQIEIAGSELRLSRAGRPPRTYRVTARGAIVQRRLWLGSDHQGRDIAARVVHGARRSLRIGLVSAALSLIVGTLLGMIVARGGAVAELLGGALLDAALAVPRLLVAFVLALALGATWWSTALVIVAVGWVDVARLVEQESERTCSALRWAAATSAGVHPWRALTHHLLPGLLPLLVSLTPLLVGRAMLLEAALSFLGFSSAVSDDSWGRLIADGRRFLPASWVMVLLPGMLLLAACHALSRATQQTRNDSWG